MIRSLKWLLAALALTLAAAPALAQQQYPWYDGARFSMAAQGGVLGMTNTDKSFAPEADLEPVVALNPAWTFDVQPGAVCPVSYGVQTGQLAIEPRLSILLNPRAPVEFAVQAGWGFFWDTDGDHGVERRDEAEVAFSAVKALVKDWALMVGGRYGLSTQEAALTARVSYLLVHGGKR